MRWATGAGSAAPRVRAATSSCRRWARDSKRSSAALAGAAFAGGSVCPSAWASAMSRGTSALVSCAAAPASLSALRARSTAAALFIRRVKRASEVKGAAGSLAAASSSCFWRSWKRPSAAAIPGQRAVGIKRQPVEGIHRYSVRRLLGRTCQGEPVRDPAADQEQRRQTQKQRETVGSRGGRRAAHAAASAKAGLSSTVRRLSTGHCSWARRKAPAR